MAVRITLNNPVPLDLPGDGWIVGYKILGDPGAYTVVGPFVALPIEIDTLDPGGTLYEGYIIRDCGDLESAQFFWQTPCDCTNAGVGYVVSPGGDQCELIEDAPADVTNSGYCLATSQDGAYSNYCSRIYTNLFVDATLDIDPFTIQPFAGGTNPGIYEQLVLTNQWRNDTASTTLGPLNREGVWIDADCNGARDALGVGVETTIAALYNNVGVSKTIYVGVAGDNQFQLVVNGVIIATFLPGGDHQFKIWHIIPITVVPGPNYINLVGTGDGLVQDAIGMVLYDNTAAEIAAAITDLDLTIPFQSSTLRGTTFDVSTCPPGSSLDVSGGPGNYLCITTTYGICNAA